MKAHKQLLDLHALGLNCVGMIYSWHNALFEWLYSDIFTTVTIMLQSFFVMTQPLFSYSEKYLHILLLNVIYIKKVIEEILVKTNKNILKLYKICNTCTHTLDTHSKEQLKSLI